MAVTELRKRSAEAQYYEIDLSKQPLIVGGDTLSSVVSVTADMEPNPSGAALDLTISNTSIAAGNKGIQFKISGGSNGNRYRIIGIANTAGGSILAGIGFLVVDDEG